MKKILEYYRDKIEYFDWVRTYLEGCRNAEEKAKAVNFKSHKETKKIKFIETNEAGEILRKVPKGTTVKIPMRFNIPEHFAQATLKNIPPDPDEPPPPEQIKTTAQKITEKTLMQMYEILHDIFKEGQHGILDYDVIERNAFEKISKICADMQGVYKTLMKTQQPAQKFNLAEEDIEAIIVCDRFSSIIANKAFEYIGYHRGKMASVKKKSDAGSTCKKEKEKCKAHILKVLEEKPLGLENEDIDNIVAELKKALENTREPKRTIKRYIKEIQKERGITIDGSWLKFRRPKQEKS